MTINEFDLSNYLDSKEMIAEYLSQVLEDGDMDELFSALGYIAKAKGMSHVSKDTGLGRESLYKTLAKGSKPKFETVIKVLNSLGIKLQVVA